MIYTSEVAQPSILKQLWMTIKHIITMIITIRIIMIIITVMIIAIAIIHAYRSSRYDLLVRQMGRLSHALLCECMPSHRSSTEKVGVPRKAN